ncbi:uncharacterized protein LOC110942427 isoform X4 [Helianthus annuus]|uniref:uncharacterized protein LOC110942427 isoform X4 n=1 Tax=Helianthus annuus TaxID=4232 RepID=UPI0016530A8E|nr:uncharacterized protein LOC110942427 isoform X4 [Helianthus annuus]
MENGVRFDDGSNLTERLANLSVGDGVNGCRSDVDNINGVNKSDGLFQVMKAVEAAEATIKQQMEENQRLRSELQKRDQELEDYLYPQFNVSGHGLVSTSESYLSNQVSNQIWRLG